MSSSGRIAANGQELYFEIHGHGPPLVLVMGIVVPPESWRVPYAASRVGAVVFS